MTTQILLNEWLETYQKEHIKARTYSRYQGLISMHILPALGATNISELGRREIQEFLTQQKKDGNIRNGKKLSATSANMMLSVLNLAFEYACDMEYIEENPCLRVRRTKAETKKIEAFTVEEQRAIESEPEEHQHWQLLPKLQHFEQLQIALVQKQALQIKQLPNLQ